MREPGPNDELLQKAWRVDTARSRGGRDCPGDEAIYEAVAGSIPPPERRRIIEHTAECGACAQSWRLATELRRARPDVVAAEHRSRRDFHRPVTWTLAAAACVFAAVGVFWLLPHFDPGTPPPGDGSVLRGGQEQEFALEGPDEFRLSDESIVLSWEAVEGAREYRLRIVGEDLENLHVQRLDSTRIALPPAALSQTDDGETVYWFVQAELENGTQRRSKTASAIIRRNDDEAREESR